MDMDSNQEEYWFHLREGPTLEEVTLLSQISSRLKYICFDVSQKYLFLGANSGGLYVFKKYPVTLMHLLPNPDGSITYISCSPDSKFVAVGCENGLIAVYEMQHNGLKKIQSSQHCRGYSITAMTWDSRSSELFVGSSGGDIVLVNVTSNQAIHILMEPSLKLFQLNGSIHQLDYHKPLLLISTDSRTYISDVTQNSYSQVGSKKRSSPQGACWFPVQIMLYGGVGSHVAYCARPGLRLWESDSLGSVLKTYNYKDIFPGCPQSEPYRFYSNCVSKNRAYKDKTICTFSKVIVFKGRYLLSYDRNGFAILRPNPPAVLLWCTDFEKDVSDVRCVGNDVYVQEIDGTLHHFIVCDIMNTFMRLAESNSHNAYYELLQSCIQQVKPLRMYRYTSKLATCIHHLKRVDYDRDKLYYLQTLFEDAFNYKLKMIGIGDDNKVNFSVDTAVSEKNDYNKFYSSTLVYNKSEMCEEIIRLPTDSKLPDLDLHVIAQSLGDIGALSPSFLVDAQFIRKKSEAFFNNSKQLTCKLKNLKRQDLCDWMTELKDLWMFSDIFMKTLKQSVENAGIDVQITQLFLRYILVVDCCSPNLEHPLFPENRRVIPSEIYDLKQDTIDTRLCDLIKKYSPILNLRIILVFLREQRDLWLFGTWSLVISSFDENDISRNLISSVESNNVESLGSLLLFGDYPIHVVLYVLYHLVEVNLEKAMTVCCYNYKILNLKDVLFMVLHHFDINNKRITDVDMSNNVKLQPEFAKPMCMFIIELFEKSLSNLVDELRHPITTLWMFEVLFSDQSELKPARCDCLYPIASSHIHEFHHDLVIESLVRRLTNDLTELACDIFYHHSYWRGYLSLKSGCLPMNLVLQLSDINLLQKYVNLDNIEAFENLLALRMTQSNGSCVCCLNCKRLLRQVSVIKLIPWEKLADLSLKKIGCKKTLQVFKVATNVVGNFSIEFYRKFLLQELEEQSFYPRILSLNDQDNDTVTKVIATDHRKSAPKHWGFKMRLSTMVCPSCSLSIKIKVLVEDGGIVIFPCKHAYHSVCLKTKDSLQCPLCLKLRQNVI